MIGQNQSYLYVQLALLLFFDVFNSSLECVYLKLRGGIRWLSIQMLPMSTYVVGSSFWDRSKSRFATHHLKKQCPKMKIDVYVQSCSLVFQLWFSWSFGVMKSVETWWAFFLAPPFSQPPNTVVVSDMKTIPETNIFAPENGWLGDDPFLLGQKAYFQGRLGTLVSGRIFLIFTLRLRDIMINFCQSPMATNQDFGLQAMPSGFCGVHGAFYFVVVAGITVTAHRDSQQNVVNKMFCQGKPWEMSSAFVFSVLLVYLFAWDESTLST